MRKNIIYKSVIIYMVPMFISGCINIKGNNNLSSLPEKSTLPDKLEALEDDTQGGWLQPYDVVGSLMGNPGKYTVEGMPAFIKWWCVNEHNETKQKVEYLFHQHCNVLGGSFNQGWCRSENDEPIFKANVGRGGIVQNIKSGCSAYDDIGVIAITGEGKNTDEWKRVAKGSLGFISMNKIHADADLKYRKIKQQANKRQVDRLNNENQILKGGIGNKICKKSPSSIGNIVYIGYVDNIHGRKIKVIVSTAIYESSNLLVGGFNSQTIWDEAIEWYPCQ